MKIMSVSLNNFGSYEGEHTFQLDARGLCIVLGDNRDEPRMNSNGSGKSVLIDALDWCLFGKVPRGDTADSVVNERVGKGCKVKVVLRDGPDGRIKAVVERGRAPKLLTFHVDSDNRTAMDDDETHARIEQWLGLDRDVFHAAVLFGQFDLLRFAEAKDSQRVAILTKILQLEQIDVWAERTKEARAEVGSAYLVQVNKRAGVRGRLDAAKGQDFGQQITDWENSRADRLREAVVQLNQYLTQIEDAKKVVVQEQRVRANVESAGQLPVLDLSLFDQRLADQKAKRDEWHGALVRAEAEGKQLANRKSGMSTLAGQQCDRCEQPVGPEHVHAITSEMEVQIVALREAWNTAGTYQREVEAALLATQQQREEARTEHHKAEMQFQAARNEAQSQLNEVLKARDYLAEAEIYVEQQLRPAMEKTRTEPNPFRDSQAQLDALVAQAEAELREYDATLAAQEEQLRYLDFWVEGFSQRGLKSYIMDTRLQELTDAANEWVHLLTGGTIWIRFETQTATQKGKLSNKLNIRVFRHNRDGTISERNYRSWSGGEKHRVSLGIDFGLSRLIARRASKSYDLLILDELFRHLDQAGREAAVDMLRALRREKSTVLVVDHDAEMTESFENRVTIIKENGSSRIQEESDAEAEPQGASQRDGVQADPVSVQRGAIAAG